MRKRAPATDHRDPAADTTGMLACIAESLTQPASPNDKTKPMVKWMGFAAPFPCTDNACLPECVDARSARNPGSAHLESHRYRAKLTKQSQRCAEWIICSVCREARSFQNWAGIKWRKQSQWQSEQDESIASKRSIATQRSMITHDGRRSSDAVRIESRPPSGRKPRVYRGTRLAS